MSSLSSFAFFPGDFAADMDPLSPRQTRSMAGTVTRTLAAATCALTVTAIGCSGSGSGSGNPSPSPATTATPSGTGSSAPASPQQAHNLRAVWPTYHGDNQRSGVSRSAALQPPLRRAWTRHLDGAVYAQPLVVGSLVI